MPKEVLQPWTFLEHSLLFT